jgi:hypothetical protein
LQICQQNHYVSRSIAIQGLHSIISFFVSREEGVSIVDEYDKKTLYLMLLKCYHDLDPMIKFVGCVNKIDDENFNLDILK